MSIRKPKTKPGSPPARESIADGLIREAAEQAAADVERQRLRSTERLRTQLASANKRARDLEVELDAMQDLREILSALEANPLERHRIDPVEKTSRKHEATAVLILSDLHFEESVDPAEINGLNEFNLEIAASRMDRLATGLCWLLELARSKGSAAAGYQITDLFLPCLGDVITNYLRNEDVQSNFLTPFEAVIYAEDLLVRFVRTVLSRCPWLKHVYMPIVPGNHDRMSFSKGTPFRKRVGMSLAPILAHGIARELADDKRVKIELSLAEHHYTEIYGHTVRGMHGDRFKYGGGVGGIFIPARKHVAGLNKAIHAHVTMFGHWHTSKADDLWVSNGSLIGPNTYSIGLGLDPEPPAQMFLLLDKDRGKRLVTPVQVDGEEAWS